MKKTIEDRFFHWVMNAKQENTNAMCAYEAGWRAHRRLAKKEMDAKSLQIFELQNLVSQLLDAIDGYQRDYNRLEALNKARGEWVRTCWKNLEIGDVVKFIYGKASEGVWRKK